MKISVMGMGYVGLVTGACLAEKGHQVTCVDVDKNKVEMLNKGKASIFEKGLEELLLRNVGKRLWATLDARRAIIDSEMTLIAVGTPFDGSRIDLAYVKEVARTTGRALGEKLSYHSVIVKSTVVPGTTDKVVLPILQEASKKQAGHDFGVGFNPEFLTEGEAVCDFMNPDRIVCGGIDTRTQEAQEALYAEFSSAPILRTNNRTAEMIKYASNSLLATLISFSNELANLGSKLGGIDTVEVMKGLHLSRYLTSVLEDGRRITPEINSFLMAGCGFGGSCLPKDVNALIAHGQDADLSMDLLKAVISINKEQPYEVFRLLRKHFPSIEGKRVCVLGLSFRPETNDMRESPAIPILRRLLAEGAEVIAYDPAAAEETRKIFEKGLHLAESLENALYGAEAVVLVTRWKEFEKVPAILSSLARAGFRRWTAHA